MPPDVVRIPLTVLAMRMAGTAYGDGASEVIYDLMQRVPEIDDEVRKTFKVKTNPIFKWVAACDAAGEWKPLEIGATNFDSLKVIATNVIRGLAEANVPSSDDSDEDSGKGHRRTKKHRADSTSTQEERRDSRGPAHNLIRLAEVAKACLGLTFAKGLWSGMKPDRATVEGRELVSLLASGASYRFLDESKKVGAQSLLEQSLADTISQPWIHHAIENMRHPSPYLFSPEIVGCDPARAAILRAMAPLVVAVWLRLEPHGSAPEMPVSVALHLAALPVSQMKSTTKERFKTLMISDYWVGWVKSLRASYPDWYPSSVAEPVVAIPARVRGRGGDGVSPSHGGGGRGTADGGYRGIGDGGYRGGGFRGFRGGGRGVMGQELRSLTCFKCQGAGHKAWECPGVVPA